MKIFQISLIAPLVLWDINVAIMNFLMKREILFQEVYPWNIKITF